MKTFRGVREPLQLQIALILSFHTSSLLGLNSNSGVSLDITRALDQIPRDGQIQPPKLETLLNYGNQYGYYTSDYPITTFLDVLNMTRTTSKRIPSKAKVFVSFSNFEKFGSTIISDANDYGMPSPSNINGVVLSEPVPENCKGGTRQKVDTSTIKQLRSAFHPVKIGFGVKVEHIACQHLLPLIQASDFVIVSIRFVTRIRFPESYGLFSAAMDSHEKSVSSIFARSSSPAEIVFLVKLEPLPKNETVSKGDSEYVSMLQEFAFKWAGMNRANVILDLPEYNRLDQSGSLAVSKDESGPSTFVIPSVHQPSSVSALKNSYPTAFNTVSSAFRSLHLKDESVTKSWSSSLQHRSHSNRLSHPLDITVEFSNKTETSFRKLVTQAAPIIQSVRSLKTYNVHVKVAEFVLSLEWDDSNKYTADITPPEVKKLLGGVSLGCLFWVRLDSNYRYDAQELVAKTKTYCSVIFEHASHFTWYTDHALETYISFESYMDMMQPTLNHFLEARNILFKIKPNATVVLKFYHYSRQLPDRSDKTIRNFYCNTEIQRLNEYFQAVLNWGRIHHFPILWKEAFETSLQYGWWSPIEPGVEIAKKVAAVAPHFVMRNYPKKVINWKVDPCVIWSSRPPPPPYGIQFNWEFAGATVDLGVRSGSPLSVKEVQTMLVFSLRKFNSLEILVGHKEPQSAARQVQVLREALSTNFMELLELNEIRHGKLWVQIPTTNKMVQNSALMREIDHLAKIGTKPNQFRLQGIHLANWEDRSPKAITSVLKLGNKYGLKVGLSVQNCSALLNNLPNFPPKIKLLSKVNYILCQISPKPAENEQMKFARYMDAQLYLSSLFSRFFSNLSVHFRLNTYPCCGSAAGAAFEEIKTANMLSFLNDVNQFAGGNNLRYFMVQAFSPNRNSTSWWHIENDTDYTNTSVYLDNETKYHGAARLIWVPNLNVSESPSAEPAAQGSPWFWVYCTASTFGLIVFFLLVVTAVLYTRLRRKSRLLSEYEVQEFLNGSSAVRFLPKTARLSLAKENEYNSMKFDDKFSLPKEDFKFADECDLLGSGQFGRVIRAVLQGSEVAVKVPYDGCTKESFKSMLTEVKVMSYVGSHQNVVTFIGCYVREISNGVIYIATELCQNGSLLEYLRRHPPSIFYSPDKHFKQELIKFSIEIASGMEYIGSKNVVHGDLSARNVLLTSDNTCKITDFGLSRKLYQYNKYVKKSHEPLPWQWMAHESLTRLEFTTQSDVWSYGVTLWEIFSLGDTPYPGKSWTIDFGGEIRDGMRLTKPDLCSKEIYLKMLACWNLDPKSRPMFTFLKDFMEGYLEAK